MERNSFMLDNDAEKQLLLEALESIGGMIVADAENTIIYMNESYAQSMGVDKHDALYRKIEDVAPNSVLANVSKTGREVVGSFYVAKSGQKILVNRFPIIRDQKLVGVVGVTALGNMDAVDAMRSKINQLNEEVHHYRSQLASIWGARYSLDNVLSSNPRMIELKNLVKNVSQTRSTVLISGESGVGKELFAHSVHQLSDRAQRPFIRLNCAAIPETLLESELFGYEAGAFTGAKKEGGTGKFEMADGGTLFLDEINSIPLSLQTKLLRVIQEREIPKIGSSVIRNVDIRFVFSTNKDLLSLVKTGQFREDLYYRINVVELHIPPLRERIDDIPTIIAQLIPRLNRELGLRVTGIAPEVLDMFMNYSWPGNVRELENVVERGFNNALSGELKPEHFQFLDNQVGQKAFASPGQVFSLQHVREEAEKGAILRALGEANGNITVCARKLRIDRSALYGKMNKYGIEYKRT